MQVVLGREGKREERSEGNELREGHIPRIKVLIAAEAMERRGMSAPKRFSEALTGLSHVKPFSSGEWEEIR